MEKSNGLKILWNSNAPYAPTGYGVQTGAVCYRLLDKGYNVRVAANYGLEGASLGFNNLIVYPKLFGPYGEDALTLVCQTWKPDVLITLYDIWVGKYSSHLKKENWMAQPNTRWIPWIPIDHMPIPDPVAEQATHAFKPVAMSKFGKKELERCGINAEYIPHGVDTKVYKPLDKTESKDWVSKHSMTLNPKNSLEWNEESFIVGINAANKDPFRKDFGRMFTAFQIFLENNPDAKKDARFYVHGWLKFPGGFNLYHLAKKLGIEAYCRATFDYDMFCSMPPEKMAKLYNGFDVFLNLARGEGFGVPIMEAQACGVPVVATDFTAMTELVKGHGWLVPPFGKEAECPECNKKFCYGGGAHQFSHLMSLQAIPDEWKAAEAIEEAYNSPKRTRRLGKKARKFSLNYDFDKVVVPAWMELLDEIDCAVNMFGAWNGKDEAFDKIFAEATK